MLTKKKIALLLVTIGVAVFVQAIFYFNDVLCVERTELHSFNSVGRLTYMNKEITIWFFMTSIVMIGTGSYLAGSLKNKNSHHLTLDFTQPPERLMD